MADGTQHGFLNDAPPNQGAPAPRGQDFSADLVDFDLQQLMGIEINPGAPLPGTKSPQGRQSQPVDLSLFGLHQLMGIDISSDAPLPPPNTDTSTPPPRAAEGAPATNVPPGEGTVIEDVIADASGGDDGGLPLDELSANAPSNGGNPQGPRGEEASLDLVNLNLEALLELTISGIGQIEDITDIGDDELDIPGLGSLAPTLGQPIWLFSTGFTAASPVVGADDGGSGGDTNTPDPDPPNNAPAATDDGVTTDEDTAITLAVLGNDSDPDSGDTLSVSAATQGANGAVVINGDGTITYIPNANFNGADSFTYTIDDGNGGSATATATVTITAVNDAPVATDDATTTAVDTAVIVSVLANDSDPDTGDTLSITGVTQGANGTVVDNGDGTLTYTPNLSFTGLDTFTYTVDDSNGGTDTASVTATVGNLIEGGAGDDTLNGTSGVDVIFGYGGDDTLSGKEGNDSLHGGAGDDDLRGQDDDDTLFGGADNDLLRGQAGNDALFGEDGDDDVRGGDGNDTLDGGAGNDFLRGGNGVDDLTGGDGNDTVDGGAGSDIARGGLGDDILVWDAIDTTIDGGTGIDTLRIDGGNADLTAFGGTLSGIEVIDLEADTGANTVTLAAQDVLDISDTDTVTITGDGGDSVEAGTGWTDGGISGGFHSYTQGLATLLVDTDVTVNADITA